MSGVHVVRVATRDQLEQAWDVRLEVFVREQGVPLAEEVDDLDTAATTAHVIALDAGGTVLGTGRLLSDAHHPGEVHLGRIAVRAAARGRGVGARVVTALEGIAVAEHGVPVAGPDGTDRLEVRVILAAQEAVLGFYDRLGYAVVSGERFLDAGIWHQDMARTLTC